MPFDGSTLIAWGFRPGPWFKDAVACGRLMAAEGRAEAEIRAAITALAPVTTPDIPAVVTTPNDAAVPIAVVGEHDERTLAQLERCAAYGSVAGAAICADGHLGYAQPVGGVVAYAEHVSVSGVGFDIACGNLAVRTDLPLAALPPARLTAWPTTSPAT